MLIGEIYLPVERLVAYYGARSAKARICRSISSSCSARWNARAIARSDPRLRSGCCPTGGWPNWVLGNHDKHRIATRIGAAQARVAAMLLLTLRGTPTLYYGDEIGMQDVPIPRERVQDPFEKRVPGLGLGRDPERTPMQWDASADRRLHTRHALAPGRGRLRQDERRRSSRGLAIVALPLPAADRTAAPPAGAHGRRLAALWRPTATFWPMLRIMSAPDCWSPSTSARRRTACRSSARSGVAVHTSRPGGRQFRSRSSSAATKASSSADLHRPVLRSRAERIATGAAGHAYSHTLHADAGGRMFLEQ